MAVSDLNPIFAAWGAIQQAVAERASTQAVWTALRSVLTPEGGALPAGSFAAVNTMRGLAASVRNASEHLASAADTDAITDRMISQNINSRDMLQQSLAPSYEVRYRATVSTEQGATEQWFTAHTTTLTGLTKGDLISALTFNNEALSQDYGAVVSGVGSMSISSV